MPYVIFLPLNRIIHSNLSNYRVKCVIVNVKSVMLWVCKKDRVDRQILPVSRSLLILFWCGEHNISLLIVPIIAVPFYSSLI